MHPAAKPRSARDGRLLAASRASGDVAVRDYQRIGRSSQLSITMAEPRLSPSALIAGSSTQPAMTAASSVGPRTGVRRLKSTGRVGRPSGPSTFRRTALARRRLVKTGPFAFGRSARQSATEALRGHERNIWEVRFSPRGEQLGERQLRQDCTDVGCRDGKPSKVIRARSQAVVGLGFSPDGNCWPPAATIPPFGSGVRPTALRSDIDAGNHIY